MPSAVPGSTGATSVVRPGECGVSSDCNEPKSRFSPSGTASAMVCAGKSCRAIATSPNARSRSRSATSRRPRSASSGHVRRESRLAAAALGGEDGDDPASPARGDATADALHEHLGGDRLAVADGVVQLGDVPLADHLAQTRPQRLGEEAAVDALPDEDDPQARPRDAHLLGEPEGRRLVHRRPEDHGVLGRVLLQMEAQGFQVRDDRGLADGAPQRARDDPVEVADSRHHCAPEVTAERIVPSSGPALSVGSKPNQRVPPPEAMASTSAFGCLSLRARVMMACGTSALAVPVVPVVPAAPVAGPTLSTRTFWKRTPTPEVLLPFPFICA